MLSLIIKDLFIQKKLVLFAAVYIFIMMYVFSASDNTVIIFTISIVVVPYMLLLGACAIDDKNKSDILLNSLPINRTHIVAARYLSSFIYMALGVAYFYIINSLVSMLYLPLKVYAINIEGLMGAFLGISFITSLYLPIYYKLGYIKSRFVNFIMFFTIFFGFNMLVSFVTNHKGHELIKQVIVFSQSKGDTEIGFWVIGFSFIMLIMSYFISICFYKKREF